MQVEQVNESEPDRRRIENFQALPEPWVKPPRGKSWERDLQIDPAAAGVKAARSQLIGFITERGNSGFKRLREMTSGEDREEEYRCVKSVQELSIVVRKPL